MSLKVIKKGWLTTVQDLGRTGFQQYGIPVAGAMDSFALQVSNLLLGNSENAPALEVTLQGLQIQFEQNHWIAACGADLTAELDDRPLPLWRPVRVKAGSRLHFRRPNMGCRAYVAVQGGIQVPEVLGSSSTYIRASIGGVQGRALQAGDRLLVNADDVSPRNFGHASQLPDFVESFRAMPWLVSTRMFPPYSLYPTVRVMPGPEYDLFQRQSQTDFYGMSFKIGTSSDRMGYRLEGPLLKLKEPKELLSEAVAQGTIQVPQGGEAIILMADRQTTGGYPRIGQVAAVDLPVLAQLKPGDSVDFAEISRDEAELLYLEQEQNLDLLRQGAAAKWKES